MVKNESAPNPDLGEDEPDNIAAFKSAAEDDAKKLREELNAAKDHLLRVMADAENARKRIEKEKEDNQKYAVSALARDLLNVSDNLRRTLDAVKREELESNPALKNLLAGIEITEKELLGAFEKHGVKKIEPKIGDAFDYNKHQAMFEIETGEKPAGTVMQVLQPGYMIFDRLLRPALVGVSKSPAPPPADIGKVDVKA